jgi:thioredoxin-dependent peroxiredoxin
MALTLGSTAPNFTTKDQDGKTVSLSDFKGKKVVLYFYPKDMTPGCTAEACSLRDNYNALIKAGYEVLGISSDDEKMHRKFIDKEKLPFRLLADTDKSVHHQFGTWVEKSMYGRKYMGTARVTYIIDENGKIAEVIEKVDTKNHAQQILGGNAAPAKPLKPAKKVATKKVAKKAVKKVAKKAPKKSSKKVGKKK